MSEFALRRVSALRDAHIMVARCVRLSTRTVDALIMSLALPVMIMLIFVYLFGGAIDLSSVHGAALPDAGGQYVTYVVPGVILLCVGFASGQTAVSVAQDMRGGIVDRFRTMDIGGPSLLTGHVVASVLRNGVATLMVFGVAFAIGFRPHAGVGEWLAAAGILLLFMLALSWLAATLGLLAGEPEAAAGYSFFISFLPYPSSAFVPVDTMPSWLQGIARHQPVTPVVESVRGLLLDGPVAAHVGSALIGCGAILLVAVGAAALVFRHRATNR